MVRLEGWGPRWPFASVCQCIFASCMHFGSIRSQRLCAPVLIAGPHSRSAAVVCASANYWTAVAEFRCCVRQCSLITEPQSRSAAFAGPRSLQRMADSKLSKVSDSSLLIAAMSYRVKYRKLDSDGRPIRVHLRVEGSGVHGEPWRRVSRRCRVHAFV